MLASTTQGEIMTDNQNQPQNQNSTQNDSQVKASSDQPVVQVSAQVQGSKTPSSGMAIASLVLGIVAIFFSFIPLVNWFSFILVILGVIFGIVGIIGTGAGKKGGRGLAIAGLVVSAVALIITLVSNASLFAAVDSVTNEPSETVVAEVVEEGSQSSSASGDASASSDADANASSDAAAAGDTYQQATDSSYAVTIDSCKQAKDYNGKACVVITYTWTNNSDKAQAFYTTISDKAFQDGVELETAYMTSGESTENSTKEIKPGKSIQVKQAFVLDSKKEPVTVEVSEIFSFSDALLAKKTFNLK